MTIASIQLESDKRDLVTMSIAYLNKRFLSQEQMEQRIGTLLMDFARENDCKVHEPSSYDFVIETQEATP